MSQAERTGRVCTARTKRHISKTPNLSTALLTDETAYRLIPEHYVINLRGCVCSSPTFEKPDRRVDILIYWHRG